MTKPSIVVVDCVYGFKKCGEPALKRRWDPFTGSHRPACAKHIASATPFELLELLDAHTGAS